MDDLVGRQEIAARLNVLEGTVDQWRQRGIFPNPDAIISGRPVWYWAAVEKWGLESGRIHEAPVINEVRSYLEAPVQESALERELRLSREADK